MRATLQMSSNTALMNIMDNYAHLLEVQNQLSSGYRVNAPSDDPLATNAALSYETILAQIDQYDENIDVADSYLGLSDSALDSIYEALVQAKALLTSSSSDTTTEDMQEANAVELSAIIDELMTIANSSEGGRYLFGGTETTEEPYTTVNGYVCYSGNDEEIEVQVDSGSYMAINVTGSDVFGSLTTTVESDDLEALLNIDVGTSTSLSSLNGGEGVSGDSIIVNYSSTDDDGLFIDLSDAETLEDVADMIEQASIDLANSYDATDPEYNYVLQVQLNSEGTGLEIVQYNRTTSSVVDLDTDPNASSISVSEVGNNTLAYDLGILGTGSTTGESVLTGEDIDAVITGETLLADLDGYEYSTLTITNGDDMATTTISDVDDEYGTLSAWNLTGLSAGENCTDDGEFYVSVTDLGTGEYEINIYSGSEMSENQLVATGTGDDGTVSLESVNGSGISGTVSLNSSSVPASGSLTITEQADFSETLTTTIDIQAFVETGEATGYAGLSTSDLTSGWEIHNLEKGVDTDADGNVYVQLEEVSSGVYEVRLYSDSACTDLVASGQLSDETSGTVTLVGAAGHEDVNGQVQIEWPTDAAITAAIGSGPLEMTVTATFATVEDLLNEINYSGTYVTAEINEDGDGLTISSQLSGAYLTVSQNITGAAQSGDDYDQLSQINLNGLTAGVNADSSGTVYFEVVDDGGTYTVNAYSDSDMTTLVATGTSTSATGEIALSSVDSSGLSGSVFLTYSADDSYIEVSAKASDVHNDEYNQISQVDIAGLTSGTTANYSGDIYIEVEDTGTGIEVRVYSDSKHTNQIAEGTIAGTSGLVTLTEVNGSGIGTADNPASLYLNYTADDDDIVIEAETSSITGQEREDSLFSILQDAYEAMELGDTEACSNLLSELNDAMDQVLLARADIGSRQQRLDLLSSRHTDATTNFTELLSNEIDLDFSEAILEYQQYTNTYEAALRVMSQIIPLSLVDFI